MKKLLVGLALFLAALSAAPTARAENKVFEDHRGNTVQLFDKPCKAESITQHLNGQVKYFAGAAVMDGKAYLLCWAPFEKEGIYWLVWEDGSNGPVPMKAFKKDLGV